MSKPGKKAARKASPKPKKASPKQKKASASPVVPREPPPQDEQARAAEIRDVLTRLTTAWRARRWDDLASLLHVDAVFVAPGFKGRIEGRTACVASFKEFTDAAQVLDYRESDVAIRTWGETAALTYRFDMSWEVTGERYQETGHDALLLVREGGKWVIAWRVMVSPSA